jgi:CheY-like chemotaxis protein
MSVRDHVLVLAGSPNLLRRNLTLILQREGLNVAAVDSGCHALALGPALRPSVFLVDSELPDMPGLEFCGRMRDAPELATVPVILYTADPNQAFVRAARAAGAQGVLSMPLDGRDIVLQVANALLLLPAPGDVVSVTLPDGTEIGMTVSAAKPGRMVHLDLPKGPSAVLQAIHSHIEGTFRFVDTAYTRTTWSGKILGHFETHIEARMYDVVERTSRRTELRKAIDLPARFKLAGDAYRWGRIVDISLGGIRLTGPGDIPVAGSAGEVSFTLGIGGRPIRCGASVRWSRALPDGFEAGLAFVRLGDDQHDALVAYLFERSGGQGAAIG